MELINKIRKSRKGFTLVEIIVVLVILAILAAFTIPAMLGFINDAKGKAMISEAREVYVAAQATATEYIASGKTIDDTDLNSNEVGAATEPTGASLQMKNYLNGDITISSVTIEDPVEVAATGDATSPNTGQSSWLVTFNGTTGRVTKVYYVKDGYAITINKATSTPETTVEKVY
ncbi:MAG: type II secretion system protein [Acetobacterium sp.]|uniref:pilus assembly FimT family protein n=1 Tax=Acetobacterium sp. TaxID=1872094 RepID=UPI003242051E